MKLKLPCLLAATVAVIGYTNAAITTSSDLVLTEHTLLNPSAIDVFGHSISKEVTSELPSEKNSIDHSSRFETVENAVSSPIQRVRLKFSAEDGLRRPLLLGFTPDNVATDGVDYGYDALSPDQYPNDMFWNIGGANYIIQGVGAFDTTKQYPFAMTLANDGEITISLTDLENFDHTIDVFVYDTLLGTYHQINTIDFSITLDAGNYDNRFVLSFNAGENLGVAEAPIDTVLVNYLQKTAEIFIKTPSDTHVKQVTILNGIGQQVTSWDRTNFEMSDAIRIPVRNFAKGTYIIQVETDAATINKKVLINYQ